MNSINSNFSTSFFRNFAAAFPAPNGKIIASNEALGKATISVIKDKFTLSHEGQLAYDKHINKGDKTGSSVPVVETQADDVAEVANTEFSDPNGESLSALISRTLEANGITLKEGDRLSMSLNGKGEISIDANRSSIGGAKGDAISELCNMLSEKLNEVIDEDKALDSISAKMGVNLEKVKGDQSFSIQFSFKYNIQTENNEIELFMPLGDFRIGRPLTASQFSEFLSLEGLLEGAYNAYDPEGNLLIGLSGNRPLETASAWEQKQIDAIKKQHALGQWQKDNDFSFYSIPTTPEEKQHYNEMWRKAISEGIDLLGEGFHRNFNNIFIETEGTDWGILKGAEALVGHEILGMLANGMLAKSSGRINEYGFSIDMPGSYNGVSHMTMTTEFVHPDLYMWSRIEEVWSGRTIEKWVKADISGTKNTVTLPVHGVILGYENVGGQINTAPEIRFSDAVGLDGMNLADRKKFLDMAQKILDGVMPGLDARQFTYSTGYLSDTDQRNNKLSLKIINNGGLSDDQRIKFEQALNQNRQLVDMKLKANASGNKGQGGFTISVLDAQGNALAKDQVRLISGYKSVTTLVDSIKDMDQKQIYEFINGR